MYNCVVCPIRKLPYGTFNLAPRYFEGYCLVILEHYIEKKCNNISIRLNNFMDKNYTRL